MGLPLWFRSPSILGKLHAYPHAKFQSTDSRPDERRKVFLITFFFRALHRRESSLLCHAEHLHPRLAFLSYQWKRPLQVVAWPSCSLLGWKIRARRGREK